MEEVFKFGLTAPDMTVFGKKAWLTAEDVWYTLTETFILESGSTTRLTGMEFNKIIMEVATKANGKTINNMVMELKNGLTAAPTKESTKKE